MAARIMNCRSHPSCASICCTFDKVLVNLPPNAGVTLIVTESGRIIDHTGGGGVVFVVDLYSPFPGATQLPPGAQLLQQRIVELGWQPVAIAGGHGGSIAYGDFTALLGP